MVDARFRKGKVIILTMPFVDPIAAELKGNLTMLYNARVSVEILTRIMLAALSTTLAFESTMLLI